MMQKLNWEGYSDIDRNTVIEEIKDSISQCDGYIMNYNLFSDLALSLSIEIPRNRIPQLHDALAKFLKLSGLQSKDLEHHSEKDWLVFLNVSFSSGRGNLKTKIPEVPG